MLIGAVAKKELFHIIRDKRSLAMIFILPVFQLILFGYAVSVDVKHLKTAVYDLDGKQCSY